MERVWILELVDLGLNIRFIVIDKAVWGKLFLEILVFLFIIKILLSFLMLIREFKENICESVILGIRFYVNINNFYLLYF